MLSTFVTYALLDHIGLRFRHRQIPSFEGPGLIHITWEAFLVLVIDLNYNHHTHYFQKVSLALLKIQTEETTHVFWEVCIVLTVTDKSLHRSYFCC